MKSTLIILSIFAALIWAVIAVASIDGKPQPTLPVVNSIGTTAKDLDVNAWKIQKSRFNGDCANHYYTKGDSTRYIQVVGTRVTIDITYKTL